MKDLVELDVELPVCLSFSKVAATAFCCLAFSRVAATAFSTLDFSTGKVYLAAFSTTDTVKFVLFLVKMGL
jgi:hypothetical protein